MCGGGSAEEAEVVREERGWREVGVEARRSEYAMKERRLLAIDVGVVREREGELMGDGGWEKENGIGGREGDCECD